MLEKLNVMAQSAALWVVRKVAFVVAALLGVLGGIGCLVAPFEYGEGLSDIDQFEVLSLALVLFLTWRFFKRGRLFACSRWQLIKQYVVIHAMSVVIGSVVLFVVLYEALLREGKVTEAFMESMNDEMNIASYVLTCLLIYCFTPLRRPQLQEQSNADVEPIADVDAEKPKQTEVSIKPGEAAL